MFWLLWNYILIWKSKFMCYNNAHILLLHAHVVSNRGDQFKYSESYSWLSSHVCQPSFLLNLQSSTNNSEESIQQSRLSMPENVSECTFLHGLNKLCSDCNLLPSFRGFLRKLNWSFFKGKNSLDNCLRIRNYFKSKLFNMIFHFKNFSVCFPILSLIYKSCI